jgi:sigma-E factor negative regulatory protein RseA
MTSPEPRTHLQPEAAHQWVSDLVDGRLEGDALARRCADWAADPQARRSWHAYHLIGDVLRSDDLATPAVGDAAFLAAVRQRLAAEPVVLAPVRQRRRAASLWWRPVVAAAGFVAVAGVVVVLRQADPGAAVSPQLASRGGVLPVGTLTALDAPRAAPAASGQMLRDARVDEYLRAHREVLAGSPAALPGGAMRNVDLVATPR